MTLGVNAYIKAADGPYRHVVLFKFKDSATKEQIKAVEDAFVALKSKIDAIQSLEWGTNWRTANCWLSRNRRVSTC